MNDPSDGPGDGNFLNADSLSLLPVNMSMFMLAVHFFLIVILPAAELLDVDIAECLN